MYITRLKLVNFIGIKNGLNKTELEINFPKNDKNIIMINGKNGSGKSTIMSQLTPFKESFDDRKSLIIPGTEGIKEIDIEHNGKVYKIKHIYGKTTSSFIQEDGIELNENGGVRTCEEIIEQKLNINKEYFKIGKIGSNTTNFIQFAPTERKKYITIFIEAVKKYLSAFEIANKKAKVLNNQIKQISDDLKKLDDVETLQKKIEANSKNLEETNLIINQTNEIIGHINAEIDQLDKTLNEINYSELKSELKLKQNLYDKNININKLVLSKYGNISIDECNNKINLLNDDLNKNNSHLTKLNTLLNTEKENKVTFNNNITKINAQIGTKDEIDLDKYKLDLDKSKEAVKEYLDKFEKAKPYSQVMKDNNKHILVFLDSFKNFMTTLLSYYDVLNDKSIDPLHRNAELFFKPDFSSVFNNFSHTIVNSIKNNRELLDDKNKEYSEKYTNIKKLDILAKRPKECKIDTCPFIADALQYANLPEELNSLDKVIEGIKSSLDSNEEALEKLSDIKIAYSNIAKSFKALSPRENIVYLKFVSTYGKISEFTKTPLNKLRSNVNNLINETETIIDINNNIEILTNKIQLLETQYEKMLETKSTQLYFLKEIAELQKNITEADLNIEKYNKDIENVASAITKLNNVIAELTIFVKSLEENNDLEKDIKEIQTQMQIYEKAYSQKEEKQKKLNQSNIILQNKLIDQKNLSNSITTMKANEITINTYLTNLANIKTSFNDVSSVKKALDPKSGIPLVFIKSYLDGTEAIANELLNIAYGGKFEIKFVPTSNDFFIQVRCGENVIEDIKLASQGEISLTTISISLALIERSLGEYNIVYLDEIDGPLDKDNRESFIHIIEKQIEKLGLEQIFVISHNNAFEDCSMNLILLNGHQVDKENSDFMKNKEIIYDVDE